MNKDKLLLETCRLGNLIPFSWDIPSNYFLFRWVDDTSPKTLIEKSIHLRDFKSTIHEQDQTLFNDFLEGIEKQQDTDLKVRIRSKIKNPSDNNYLYYEFIISSIDNKDQTKLGILKDITAQHQAEQNDCMKSDFISTMSHEIRTPLNAIVGFTDLILISESEEEKAEYMKIIKSSNQFLTRLIGNVLDLSKIESGKIEFEYNDFSLKDLFVAAAQTFRLHTRPGVEIILSGDTNDYTVYSDRDRINQVLTNFMSNAVKHTDQGKIELGYTIKDDHAKAYVIDSGNGIPKEAQSKVFDRFAKMNKKREGTGLGLAISQMIIHKLNGTIGLESEENKGSTFWFEIPLKHIEE